MDILAERLAPKARETGRPSLSQGVPRHVADKAWKSHPQDVEYPGVLTLAIDATDTMRGIINARMVIPVARSGPLTLLYPKWMPGYHSPHNPLELLAGLEIRAGGAVLDWHRDPVEVYAFHLEVPAGISELEVKFQFLSPTSSTQGDVVVTAAMMNLQWGRMLLYPANHYSRRITVAPSLTPPDGWHFATVLEAEQSKGSTAVFRPVTLDVLVDSPVMAGRHVRELSLDETGAVKLAAFAHKPDHLMVADEQIAFKRALIAQTDKLFGARHFDRYKFLVALSEELGGGGVEHHRCAEIVCPRTYFTQWPRYFPKRDVFAHEFTHSWNGKFRRGADSWTPTFELPIRNSMMWVYEGQTQYWGHVLTARSGLWSTATALEALAKVAATYDVRPGGRWRTLADTTRDPIITARAPLPWPSWQRNEDYYAEGQLMWLAIDTLIRELSGDQKSLDDFARAFFGREDGRMTTLTYDFDEIVATLRGVVDHDWAGLINLHLHSREAPSPLEAIERGGYRLVYRAYRTDFCKVFDAIGKQFDMRFSIGLVMGSDGTVQEVMWGSAAFDAGLVAGARIEQVNGQPYSDDLFGEAIEAASSGAGLDLTVRMRAQADPISVRVDYTGGHRFPHLEPIVDARPRLTEIFASR